MLAEGADFVVGVDTHAHRHAFALIEVRTGALVAEWQEDASAAGYRQCLSTLARWPAVDGCGRSRGPVPTVPGWPGTSRPAASSSARSSGRCVEEARPGDPLDALRAARAALERPLATRAPPAPARLCASWSRPASKRSRCAESASTSCAPCLSPAPTHSDTASTACRRAACPSAAPRSASARQQTTKKPPPSSRCASARLASWPQPVKHKRSPPKSSGSSASSRQPCSTSPASARSQPPSSSSAGRTTADSTPKSPSPRLSGTAPIPASSGKTNRYRLDRGGDRRLNRALHTIVLARRRQHPPTIAYIERRISEGKTSREAVRYLKRYTARHLYRRPNKPPPLDKHRNIAAKRT